MMTSGALGDGRHGSIAGAQDAGRVAAEDYRTLHPGEPISHEWLRCLYLVDSADQQWTPGAWLVYSGAALERWAELEVAPSTPHGRQRAATLSIPVLEVQDRITTT